MSPANFRVHFICRCRDNPTKFLWRWFIGISSEELFIPCPGSTWLVFQKIRKKRKKGKKESKIKGTGIRTRIRERCPKSATIPGFVCHYLPPQTCFHVTESIPMGKRESFAFCVPPNMARIRINIYERRGTTLRSSAFLPSRFLNRGFYGAAGHRSECTKNGLRPFVRIWRSRLNGSFQKSNFYAKQKSSFFLFGIFSVLSWILFEKEKRCNFLGKFIFLYELNVIK